MSRDIGIPGDPRGGAWYRSSYTANNGNCVEVCDLPDGSRAVRDSKSLHIPHPTVSPRAWSVFIRGIVAGRL